MCEKKFTILFRTDITCVDDEHNLVISLSLYAKRKNMSLIPPLGMHLIFKNYNFQISEISAPFTFDIVTCKCDLYKPLSMYQVNELLTLGWREELKGGKKSQITPPAVHDDKLFDDLDEIDLTGEFVSFEHVKHDLGFE